MRLFSLLNSVIFSFALLILGFAILSWAKVPVGSFGDWLGGLLAFFWLMAVVTVPWNIYFKAKAVLNDAQSTRERGLTVDDRQLNYVRKLVTTSLWAALGLHLVSAIGLYALGHFGVVKVGYVGSVIALLLTILRPTLSAYEYIAERLHSIGHAWRYPQEDVVELRGRVAAMETGLNEMRIQLDPQRPESLVSVEKSHADESRRQLAALAADLESLRATNNNEHEKLAREAKSAISQLTTDGQFLDHVREILRFFKSA